MSDLTELSDIWHHMAQRHNWALVSNEQLFLAQVAATLREQAGDTLSNRCVRTAITRAYGAVLCQGLWQRQERATEEVWRLFLHSALRDGREMQVAEEIAQETITRVLEKLPTLRVPESFIYWGLMILRTVCREQRASPPEARSVDANDPATDADRSPADLSANVEQWLLHQDILRLLHIRITNEFERRILIRNIFLGEHPRDIARALGVPPHRIRLTKSRVLSRLRNDTTFLRRLQDIIDDAEPRRNPESARPPILQHVNRSIGRCSA